MLVSDNCTTAVNHKKSDWYNTALNNYLVQLFYVALLQLSFTAYSIK